HQASTDATTAYIHRRIGHLPMALHPNPRAALVIGLGGGATAGAVSVHGSDVDVVELSSAVVDGARFFDTINFGVLTPPNVHLRVDDGRNYMMLTLRLRRSDFEGKLRESGPARGLHDLNIESFDALLAAFSAGPEELHAFVGAGPLLTDDKPVVEYFLSLPRDRDVDTSSLKGDVRR